MIKVREVAFTGYPVRDIKRARDFYEGTLGLKPASVFEEGGKFWVEYEIGNSTLAISDMVPGWSASGHGPLAALEVEDFVSAIACLREKNVALLVEPIVTPVCHTATISDPDGNRIVIHEHKKVIRPPGG